MNAWSPTILFPIRPNPDERIWNKAMQPAAFTTSITAAIIGTHGMFAGYYPYARPCGWVVGAPGSGRE